jgi:cystathionine gamma-synthase
MVLAIILSFDTMKKDILWEKIKTETKAIWAGETEPFPFNATQAPTVNSVAFNYDDMDEWMSVAKGLRKGHIYGRNTNPTVEILEKKIAILEKAESATAFSSGMAAISNTLFALLKPKDRVIVGKDTYGGTSKIFMDYLPKFNIDVQFCDTTNTEEFKAEINKKCSLLYLETPTNPTLKLQNITKLSILAKKSQSLVVVDNTLSTPINQNPLELGADIVLHSATKFLCGHSDALGGLACGNKEIIEKIFHFREINGACLDPHPAYLILRGMKTLALRMNKHNENALELAQWLSRHDMIEKVFYPGLDTHEGSEIAQQQMKGYGGVLSFSIKDEKKIPNFISNLTFAHAAAHLGSLDTIVGPPQTTSHVENSAEERIQLGIPNNLIRCSVGIEHIDDIKNDFDQALLKL